LRGGGAGASARLRVVMAFKGNTTKKYTAAPTSTKEIRAFKKSP